MPKKHRRTHKAVLQAKLAEVATLEKENVALEKQNPSVIAVALIALNLLRITMIIRSIAKRVRRRLK